MKCFEISVFIAFFVSSIVYAASEKLPANSELLTCNKMELHKRVQDYDPPMNTCFVYKEYYIQPDNRSYIDMTYNIKKNNIVLNKIILKGVGGLTHTNANLCEDIKNNQYIVLEDEWEQEDDSSGKGILVIDVTQNTAKKIFRDNFDNDDYTPFSIVHTERKHFPINYTIYNKNGGLYMKVSTKYHSKTITLKKPTSVK